MSEVEESRRSVKMDDGGVVIVSRGRIERSVERRRMLGGSKVVYWRSPRLSNKCSSESVCLKP
jgi:hypothetical protein